MLKKLYAVAGFVLAITLPAHAQSMNNNYWVLPNGTIIYQSGTGTAQHRQAVPHPHLLNQQAPLVLQPNQRIVCNRNYQVHSSSRGVYEVKQDCWIQQQ